MKKQIRISAPAILAIVLFMSPATTIRAGDVDFSCMNYRVWGKGHVSTELKDYDIVLQNHCPGAVYWHMCIERIDPLTNEVVETHTPTGYVEVDKKARVNLQLLKSSNKSQFRNRFQEFYVNIGYAIEMPVSSDCFASQCENKKRALRAQIRANEAAWERAEISLAAQIKNNCPGSGWDTLSKDECEAQVRESSQTEMKIFPIQDQQLREKMAAIDPDRCQVWSGDLTEN